MVNAWGPEFGKGGHWFEIVTGLYPDPGRSVFGWKGPRLILNFRANDQGVIVTNFEVEKQQGPRRGGLISIRQYVASISV